jgi:hypothetical protein
MPASAAAMASADSATQAPPATVRNVTCLNNATEKKGFSEFVLIILITTEQVGKKKILQYHHICFQYKLLLPILVCMIYPIF